MKKIISTAVIIVAVIIIIMVVRTLNYGVNLKAIAVVNTVSADADTAARNLSKMVSIPTISHGDSNKFNPQAFIDLHRYLEESYPLTHARLEREIISGYSLLYRWPGTDLSRAPIILMGHLDVVPIEPGTEGKWEHPPFAGDIADGYVWGRGALDDKASITAIFEAIELMLADGFMPERTLYLAFGHDEEIGGREGAYKISKLLEDRGIKPDFVLDEGKAISKDAIIPGKMVASIALAEKGYVSLTLTAKAKGGHSSQPPELTSIGSLARAISALEANPFAAKLTDIVQQKHLYLAAEKPFSQRFLYANQWAFDKIIVKQLLATPSTAAEVRTTTAPTILAAGIKDNVLPSSAKAIVNFRIRPGQTIEDVVRHVKEVINDKNIDISIVSNGIAVDPSPVASINGLGFKAAYQAIREVFPDAIVTPGITLGATDSRHYQNLTDEIYRFAPLIMGPDDAGRFHGTNERIAISNLSAMVRFYAQLINNATRSSK